MRTDKRADDLRRATNPLYNDRKLKLGTFGTNLDRGCAISTIDGVLEIDWPSTMTLAKLADAISEARTGAHGNAVAEFYRREGTERGQRIIARIEG